MSSKACRTVLLPEPESPVRITRCRVSCRACGFTGGRRSALFPALVSAGNSHVFAVLCDRAARDVDACVIQLLGDLFVSQGVSGIFLFNHFLDHALEGEEGHTAALRPV